MTDFVPRHALLDPGRLLAGAGGFRLDARRLDERHGCSERDEDHDPDATRVGPALPDDDTGRRRSSAQQGNTAILIERLSPANGYGPPGPGDDQAPYGWWRGRPIIGRGSAIDGGVYLGRKPREAIVVDMGREDGELARVYYDLLNRVHGRVEASLGDRHSVTGFYKAVRRDLARHLLADVRALIAREMPFDEKVVRQIAQVYRIEPDALIDLDVYVRHRGGVCRHQVCLVGVLIERLVRDGWLDGAVSLERKHVPGWFSHAWVHFSDGLGRSFVLDPAQNVYDALDGLDAEAQAFYGPGGGKR